MALLKDMGTREENMVQTVKFIARPARMAPGLARRPTQRSWCVAFLSKGALCPSHDISERPLRLCSCAVLLLS